MKIGGGHFAPKLGGQFELESGGHFKLELGGQYHWNLQSVLILQLLSHYCYCQFYSLNLLVRFFKNLYQRS